MHLPKRPITGHFPSFANETACFVTAAVSAGLGAAMLVASASPASARPFDLWPNMRPQAQNPASGLQRVAYRSGSSKKEAKEKPNKEAEDLAAKAKGPMSVFVSIDKQQLTLYSGDQPIAHTKVSTGTGGHPTPTGVFSVIQKDRWHHSNLYGNAPMYYMQRITWSGVAMHEGYVTGSPASHGCIRLPSAFAKQLWGITKMGARVIVSRPELTPSAVSSPKLFVFKAPPEPPKPADPAVAMSADDTVKAAFNSVETATPTTATTTSGPRLTAVDIANPDPGVAAAAAKPLKPGPISVFISRKEGKLFVRKGFEPIFDAPVTFEHPDQPLGTHVFTALSMNDDNSSMRWSVVTVPNSLTVTKKVERTKIEKGKKGKTEVVVAPAAPVKVSSATEALERVTIPQDAIDRIQALMTSGASLTISDNGHSHETGKGTDFIVLTR